VWGKGLYFGATKVRANADVDSLRSRFIAENHLQKLFEATTSGSEIEDVAPPHQKSPDASAADAQPTTANEALNEKNARKSKERVSRDDR